MFGMTTSVVSNITLLHSNAIYFKHEHFIRHSRSLFLADSTSSSDSFNFLYFLGEVKHEYFIVKFLSDDTTNGKGFYATFNIQEGTVQSDNEGVGTSK